MTLESLTSFFAWMAAFNVALYAFVALVVMIAGDWMYALHARLFGLEVQVVRQSIYNWLGTYKIVVLAFSVVPYLALRMI